MPLFMLALYPNNNNNNKKSQHYLVKLSFAAGPLILSFLSSFSRIDYFSNSPICVHFLSGYNLFIYFTPFSM